MPIEHKTSGATIITGDAINYFRLCAQKGAVGLELKGIKVRRGPVIWKQVAKEYGIKGNKAAIHAWLVAKVEEMRKQQAHIEPDGRMYVEGREVN